MLETLLSVGGTAAIFPLLIMCISLVTVATIALIRAKPEDIPQVFAAFADAFGFRPHPAAEIVKKDQTSEEAPEDSNTEEAA